MGSRLVYTEFTHSDVGLWSADASDLRLKPGRWPAVIVASCGGRVYEGRNPRPSRDAEGDLRYVDYTAVGATLRVWND